MKHVVSESQVAHLWANQLQHHARVQRNNFYFDGATIYSYGRHFPIATIDGNFVLFTLRDYSNTTTGHKWSAKSAVSHKEIIYCYVVPTNPEGIRNFKKEAKGDTYLHEKNLNHWKGIINEKFQELGNKRNRDIQGRVNTIQIAIGQLNKYIQYFGLKIKDTELKKLLKLVATSNFIQQAREAKAKQDAANEKKLTEGSKAYEVYVNLWRADDTEGIKNMPQKLKDAANYYHRQGEALTRLRFDKATNRVETSKGVQIPAEIAKRAYKQLNGCMEGECKDISVPVMDYTITETGKDYIKAGCHTIPKADVLYIANLLNW